MEPTGPPDAPLLGSSNPAARRLEGPSCQTRDSGGRTSSASACCARTKVLELCRQRLVAAPQGSHLPPGLAKRVARALRCRDEVSDALVTLHEPCHLGESRCGVAGLPAQPAGAWVVVLEGLQ